MSSAHFYSPVTGQLIDGGLREARKVNGLPSPTTVLSMIKGEALIRYFRRQMWEAAATTPRLSGQSDDDHFEACVKWADQHGKAAREKGGDFHSLIQRFHQSVIGEATPPVVPAQFADQYDAYLRWYETYVSRTLAVEAAIIGAGYAGRLDHCCLLNDGRVAVTDTKTQDLKKRSRFNYYPEWALQLGAYAGALQPIQGVDVLVSVVVSSGPPPVALEAKYWERSPSHYTDLFLGLLRVWCHANNYWPDLESPQETVEGNRLINLISK